MLIHLELLWIWFLCYSIAGWLYESVLVSVQERRIVNRGFLNGPLCPIYGVGAVLMTVLLQGVGSPVVIFILSALIASVLEYVTSWIMEVIFHARWWDYSNMRFNLNGRVCLLGACVFGAGGVFVVCAVQPVLQGWSALLSATLLHWVCAGTLIMVLVDVIVTVCGIVDFEDTVAAFMDFVQEHAAKAGETWQWGRRAILGRVRELPESSSGLITRLRQTVLAMLNTQQRRMIRSFPHLRFKSIRENSVLETIREALRRRR